jgi:hypothetical protein
MKLYMQHFFVEKIICNLLMEDDTINRIYWLLHKGLERNFK